jgi:acid phosphatase (class A)
MRREKKWVMWAALVLMVLPLSAAAGGDLKFLTHDQIESLIATVPPPPAIDSDEQKQDIATLLDIQEKRTPDDVERANRHVPITGFVFSEVLGSWFKREDLPVTAELLDEVGKTTKAVGAEAKDKYKRPRPFVTDSRIHPCVKLEQSTSYPSGHAMWGMCTATVLADVFPDHAKEIMALGKQIGEDREVGGVHYPSDVAAGQKLGAQIGAMLLANPDFQAEIHKVQDECMAEAHAGVGK